MKRTSGAPIRTVDSLIVGRSGHPIPVRDYHPRTPSPMTPMLWVHGGGFISGGLDQKESHEVALVIARTGRFVRTVDYRLVPVFPLRGLRLRPSTNRYPAPLHDVLDTYLDLAGATRTAPMLGGGSAGANLALSAALRLRDGEGRAPSGLVLAYGTFHGRGAAMSEELRGRIRLRDRVLGLLVGSDALLRMNVNYGGSLESLDDPLVFPGGSDLSDLPPVLVINADRDSLRASGEALAAELEAVAAPCTVVMIPGSVHGFLNQPGGRAFRTGMEIVTGWLGTIRSAGSPPTTPSEATVQEG